MLTMCQPRVDRDVDWVSIADWSRCWSPVSIDTWSWVSIIHMIQKISTLSFNYIPLLKQLGVSRFLLDLGILPSKQFKQSSKNNDSTISTYIKPTLIYNITENRQSSYSIFLGFTWRHRICSSQCPPCWCPSGVKFMLIIVYFYSDPSLLSLYYFANYTNIQE